MAPPKTCPKMVCPRKGVAFLWKAFLQKIFRVWEKIPLSALPFGRSHTLVAEGFSVHSSLISGLLGVEASGIRSKAFFGDKGVGQGAPLTPQRSSGKPI